MRPREVAARGRRVAAPDEDKAPTGPPRHRAPVRPEVAREAVVAGHDEGVTGPRPVPRGRGTRRRGRRLPRGVLGAPPRPEEADDRRPLAEVVARGGRRLRRTPARDVRQKGGTGGGVPGVTVGAAEEVVDGFGGVDVERAPLEVPVRLRHVTRLLFKRPGLGEDSATGLPAVRSVVARQPTLQVVTAHLSEPAYPGRSHTEPSTCVDPPVFRAGAVQRFDASLHRRPRSPGALPVRTDQWDPDESFGVLTSGT